MPKKRLQFIDVAKGIAILLMMAGHSGVPSEVTHFMYSFHMPLFFIVAGYFTTRKSFREILAKGWIQLVRPCIFTICLVIAFFVCLQVAQNLILHKPYCLQTFRDLAMGLLTGEGTGPLWFLAALFWAKIILEIILRHEKYAPAIAVACSSIAYLLLIHEINIPWYVLHGMEATVFLYVGTLLRKFKIFTYPISWQNVLVVSVAVYLSASTATLAFEKTFPLLILNVVTATVISVVVIENCMVFEKIKDKNIIAIYIFNVLNFVGKNTLIILCFHAIDMYLNLWKFLHIEGLYLFLAIRLITTCLIPLFIQYIPVLNIIYLKKNHEKTVTN